MPKEFRPPGGGRAWGVGIFNSLQVWLCVGVLYVKTHLSPGGRNPIEGKFGQAKVAYGLNKIRAKLSATSTSWIAAIALVLNLVKFTRQALVRLIFSLKIFEVKSFECLMNIQYNFNVKKAALVSL